MGLHDSLHVSGPSVLGSNEDTWGFINSCTENNLLDFVSKDVFHEFAERLEFGFQFLLLFLLLFGIVKIKSFFGD